MDLENNTFKVFLQETNIDGEVYKFYDVSKINDEKYNRLPYCIRVLLESAIRNCDELLVTSKDVKNILNWPDTQKNEIEIPFLPSRVLLQDFTGVPALVDFAAIRDAVKSFNGDPDKIQPICPADLVIDHSVQFDIAKKLIINHPSATVNSQQQQQQQLTSSSSDLSKSNSNCCLTSNSSQRGCLPNSRRPVNEPSKQEQQQQLLKQNFRNQGKIMAANLLNLNKTNIDTTTTTSAGGVDSTSTHTNSTTLNDNQILNTNQVLIEAAYKECPFHDMRTECAETLEKNQELEFERNLERFQFLKWGAQAFKNMFIVPPGSGLVHQVNLECLARMVFVKENLLYPDSLVGTDTHTTMINGLGIMGWSVGGIEAEAVMLGQIVSMVLPQVVGYRIHGNLSDLCTSTDIVLTITKNLRLIGVENKFVEFFGPGVAQLSIADRATIANMSPEYGAIIGYFSADEKTLEYLLQTGQDRKRVKVIKKYLKLVQMLRDYTNESKTPAYSEVHELDLSTVVPCVSGPKRPQDKIVLVDLKNEFRNSLTNQMGLNGFGLKEEDVNKKVTFPFENNRTYTIEHGSVVIAAITSCTNTSNPSAMLAAGLVAKKARDLGLTVNPYIKTSLSPGSGVVTEYLSKSGMLPYLESLGFNIVGYGCMNCIGNSTPLTDSLVQLIEKNELITVGVLSGNRNFEGRIHPSIRANYLASPPLVVAYAIAGRVNIDFEKEPIGFSSVTNRDVYLSDIWPRRKELHDLETSLVIPEIFNKVYAKIAIGSKQWTELMVPDGQLYPWNSKSTYIKRPPFFDNMNLQIEPLEAIKNASVLLYLGDSITTDHISPAGSIARNSPAAKYLSERGLVPRDFNSYGSRRGNDAVMSRGTFANVRLVNKICGTLAGPKTIFFPTKQTMDIFDAAENYKRHKIPVIVIAGKDYGSGSSRDWAVKGPWILGIKAILAESFDRVHRNNLVGMGIIPFQFLNGQTGDKLKLTGRERFTFNIDDTLSVKQIVNVETDTGLKFQVLARIDTTIELDYIKHGGILKYMIRKYLQ